MPQLDVFNQNAFSLQSRTAAVNKMPFKPGKAGRLPIWTPRPVTTTTITVEERDGHLSLIPTSQRGGPAPQLETSKRTARAFAVPHLKKTHTMLLAEIQDIRAFGTDELQTVEALVAERESDLVGDLDVTTEYHQLGAVKGISLDADGIAEVTNSFTAFGVTQETEVAFDLAVSTGGTLMEKCTNLRNTMQDNLGADTFDHVHCFMSTSFAVALMKNPEVRDAYTRWAQQAAVGQMGDFLRNGLLREQPFPFGPIVFEEYRGSVGGVDFIPADKAIFFPVGARNLFMMHFAPSTLTPNTLGLPRYSNLARDPEFGEWVKLRVESNPLPLCVRPKVLMKGKKGA